jgi:predicted amidohydrolase
VLANVAGRTSNLEFFGRSRIVDPTGEILAEGAEGVDAEELVVADIPDDLRPGTLPFRLIDRRRPDLYGEILSANAAAGEVEWR